MAEQYHRVMEARKTFVPPNEEYWLFQPPFPSDVRDYLEVDRRLKAEAIAKLNLIRILLTKKSHLFQPDSRHPVRWKMETYILMVKPQLLEGLEPGKYYRHNRKPKQSSTSVAVTQPATHSPQDSLPLPQSPAQ